MHIYIYSNFEIQKQNRERERKNKRIIDVKYEETKRTYSVDPREQHTVYIYTYTRIQFTLPVLFLNAMLIY